MCLQMPGTWCFFMFLFYKNSSWLKLLPLVINIGHYYFISFVVVVVNAIQFNLFCVDPVFSSLSNITESFNALLTRNGTTNVYYIDFSVKYCHRHPNKYFVTFQLVACIVWSRSSYTKKSGETINKLMALNESSLISNQWM